MNMEATNYQDDCLDSIVMANTLSYTADTAQTIREISQILKLGRRYVLNATYGPSNPDYSGDCIRGCEIAKMLNESGLRAYCHVSYDKMNSRECDQTSHTFAAQKQGLATSQHDPLGL